MTEYQKLVFAEQIAHTVEIVELRTGKTGVVKIFPYGVAVFYGSDDGSDDKVITPRQFNRNFKVTVAVIS